MSKRLSKKALCKLLEKYTEKEIWDIYRITKHNLEKWKIHYNISPLINPIDVKAIRELKKNGMSYIDIAYKYDTSEFVILSICIFKSWATFK